MELDHPRTQRLLNDPDFLKAGEIVTFESKMVGFYHPDFRYRDEPYVCFGYWQASPDNNSSQTDLFLQLQQWAESKGVPRILGPINGATAAGYRLKIDQFEAAPFYQEPTNPESSIQQLEENGFTLCERYYSWLGPLTTQAKTFQPMMAPLIEQLKQQHSITCLPLQTYWESHHCGPGSAGFTAFKKTFYNIAETIFSNNLIYSKITPTLFDLLYGDDYFQSLCPLSSVIAVKDKKLDKGDKGQNEEKEEAEEQEQKEQKEEKEMIGFFFAVPDYLETSPTKRILAKTGGVLPQYRKSHLFTVMSYLISAYATPHYQETGAVMVHENNPSARVAKLVFSPEQRRSYGLYERTL